jgi:hypothetical protein
MADKVHKILPHGPIEELAPGLWSVTGDLPIPLKRNMVVYRLKDGTLLLHSVIAMEEEGMKKLEALGKPSVLIVPHGGHRMDAKFYKERYPAARVLAPPRRAWRWRRSSRCKPPARRHCPRWA